MSSKEKRSLNELNDNALDNVSGGYSVFAQTMKKGDKDTMFAMVTGIDEKTGKEVTKEFKGPHAVDDANKFGKNHLL